MSAHAASRRQPVPVRRPALAPEPVPAPAPGPPAVAGRRRAKAAGALVAALLSAALAWTVLSSLGGAASPRTASERTVTLGPASVSVPAGWEGERRADVRLPELGAAAEVLAPAPGLSAHAVVVLSSEGPPAPLRVLLGDLGRGRSETLAGLPATRYAPRPVGGGRVADVTVAETTSGTLTVACIAREDSWTGAAGCADAIAAGRGLRAAP